MGFHRIAAIDDIWSGEMTGLIVEGIPVLLINVNGVVRAYRDACPHLKSRLSQGSLHAAVLTCATHHWQFDACTGSGINPRNACLDAFDIRVQDGEILLDVEQLRAVK